MPLENGLLIACKSEVVELTVNLVDPHTDAPGDFEAALADRLYEHRYLSMTDPTLLEGEGLDIASVVLSRTPVPDPLRPVLLRFGLRPEDTEAGGRARTGLFARLGSGTRSRLDRWRLDYARAGSVSKALGEFEADLVQALEDVVAGDLLAAERAVQRAAETYLGVSLEPTVEGLARLESTLALRPGHDLVLHPAAVSGLAGFVASTLLRALPGATYDVEADSPILLPVRGEGPSLTTDPEFRVIEYVRKGRSAGLAAYVRSLEAECRSGSA